MKNIMCELYDTPKGIYARYAQYDRCRSMYLDCGDEPKCFNFNGVTASDDENSYVGAAAIESD
jgi:hypothetical protein